ncbi:DUF2194 domain-containing protein, partial [Aduncisulcus paluster]
DNVDLAKTLFELENVETSSHSYTHPFAWNAKMRESKEYAEDFVVGQYEVAGYKFDAHYEIVGSCDYISENLAPAEKPCRVLFWSGMCEPTEEQVGIAEKAGILNLNGGDTVLMPVEIRILGFRLFTVRLANTTRFIPDRPMRIS